MTKSELQRLKASYSAECPACGDTMSIEIGEANAGREDSYPDPYLICNSCLYEEVFYGE